MFFFSSRRRHTRCLSDWSSDVCSSDLDVAGREHLGDVCPNAQKMHPCADTAASNAVVLRVARKEFLGLMREQPELCQQATDMLSREVSFIQAAVGQRMRSLVSFKPECEPTARKVQSSRAVRRVQASRAR